MRPDFSQLLAQGEPRHSTGWRGFFFSPRSGAAMRWLLAILLVVLLVIVDQFKFRGYYTSEVSRLVRNAVTSITR